jgi:hypothetical protein
VSYGRTEEEYHTVISSVLDCGKRSHFINCVLLVFLITGTWRYTDTAVLLFKLWFATYSTRSHRLSRIIQNSCTVKYNVGALGKSCRSRRNVPETVMAVREYLTAYCVAGFPQRRPGLEPGSGHMGFVVDKVALG